MAYENAKELAEEREIKKEQKEVKSARRRLLEPARESSNDEVNKKMLRAAKILERMVNQNTFDEIAQVGVNKHFRKFVSLFRISGFTRTLLMSSVRLRGRCYPCGNLGSNGHASWRSRPFAGTQLTTTSSLQASDHVGIFWNTY